MLGGAACRTEMDHEPINEIDHVYKKRVEFCLPSTYFRDFVLAVYLLWTWSVSLIGSWSISVRHAPPPQSENQTGREATGREPLPAPQPTWISDRNGDSISKSAIQRRFDIHRRSIGDSISKSVEGGAGCAPQTIDRSICWLRWSLELFVGTLTETIHQATLAAARASQLQLASATALRHSSVAFSASATA